MRKVLLIFICLVVIWNFLSAAEKSIGLELSEYKYCEFDNKELMNIKGERVGLSYEYLSCKNTKKSLFWAYQYSLSWGNVIYNGTPQDKSAKIRVHCYDFYTENRLLYGLVLIPFNNEYLTTMPYLGCGLRVLYNKLGDFDYTKEDGSRSKIYGYNRCSIYFYMPFGVKLRTALNNGWIFSFNPEFNWLLLGEQISDIDTGDGSIMKNLQHKGYGLRVSITTSKKMNNKCILFLEPFIKYWNIDISEKKSIAFEKHGIIKHGYYFEPKNNTMEYGVKIGVTF
jgi:hypothetical protein